MQKSISIFVLLSVLILTLSNFTQKTPTKFVIFAFNEEPKLPETPYVYDDVDIPDHLNSPEEDQDIGYGASSVGTGNQINIDDDRATLGRVLFYDTKLSALEDISCATCHKQELSFADDTPLSDGTAFPTKRNSMALNDLFWTNRSHFLWDMRETDLNKMIRLPLKDENEIGADMDIVIEKLNSTTYYPQLFFNAYNTSTITEDKIVEALIHFISSMVTFDSRFDQQAANDFVDFTEQEITGLELFSENCTVCHSQGSHNPFDQEVLFNNVQTLFLFPEIFNNGLPADPNDKGAGEHDEFFTGLFKIPTLRNVDYTAPYMHDGSIGSLEEVVEHYSSGVIANEWTIKEEFVPDGGFQFSDYEKESLVAFLKTLKSEKLVTHPMYSDPFDFIQSSEEFLPIIEMTVRPNPIRWEAIAEFNNDNKELTTINILTSTGQLIKTSTTTGSTYIIKNTLDFNPGIYFLEVIQKNKKSMQKIVVSQ